MRIASLQRDVARQLVLALLFLALGFLNLGHSSAVFADGGRVVFTGHSICGDDGSTPAPGEHFACHACRQDAPVLPPSPVAVEPVSFRVQPVVYADSSRLAPPGAPVFAPRSRGPPAAV